MENITMKVLARKLNLSATTISKALKDSHEISGNTKRKVIALAAELNYTPNAYAGSLRTKKSLTIGVVIPEITDHFFAEAISGIEAVAEEQGYHVLVYLTHENFQREKSMLRNFKGGRVDGILISVASDTTNGAHIQQLMEENIPVVFFDRACNEVAAAKVITDDFESAQKATQHLLSNGVKRPALLLASETLAISNERYKGFTECLKKNKLPIKKEHVLLCGEQQEALPMIKKILQHKNRPDGIVCSVDKFTLPVYLACQELQLSIPHDVKVISFSNNPSAVIFQPALSVIVQPAFEMGKLAAVTLFKELKKKKSVVKECRVIPSVLVARASSIMGKA